MIAYGGWSTQNFHQAAPVLDRLCDMLAVPEGRNTGLIVSGEG